MRRTRILTTLGPASDDAATIRALLDAGTDAFRLNFSHGTVERHRQTCARIRDASEEAGRHVAVLQDLSGPKIRIGPLDAPLDLRNGETIAIEQGTFVGEPGRVSCAFDALFTSVQPGQRLLLDDGRLELTVEDLAPRRIVARVVSGGLLEGRKGINLPDTPLRAPALTAKDLDDLRAGVEMGVDLIAVSFVQSPEDVTAARAAAAAAGAPDLPIVAKIERPQALEHIDDILRVSDGLMVARGDLGIELPLETVPAVQGRLIRAARSAAVPVIVATQVLESMRFDPRPTRAEVTDAAHAVDQGADAIMLAGETAAGRYPVRAVTTLDTIVREAEKVAEPAPTAPVDASIAFEHGRALAEAAVTLAARARASAIVAVTEAGRTARLLSSLRPAAPILAATSSVQTAARLSLVWGVTPIVAPAPSLGALRRALVDRALVASGATVVFASIQPVLGREDTNYVHVERL